MTRRRACLSGPNRSAGLGTTRTRVGCCLAWQNADDPEKAIDFVREALQHLGDITCSVAQLEAATRLSGERRDVEDTRLPGPSGPRGYAFGPFVVDPIKWRLWREGRLVPITGKTFDLLLVLLENRDRIIRKDELMNRVWPDTAVDDNNLPRQMSFLRRALGQRPDQHDYVVTIPGHGYRFVANVQELAGVPPESHAGRDVHSRCRQSRRWSSRILAPVMSPRRISRFPESTRRCRIRARRPPRRGGGRSPGHSPSRAADFWRWPWRLRCCVRIRFPSLDGPCSASPMKMRLCRETPRGRPTASGWST